MTTTRWILGAALLGSVLSLQGCASGGPYLIPNVEPVVKPKPDTSLLDDIEGTGDSATDEKAVETKPSESTKPETTKPEAQTPKAAASPAPKK